MIVNKKYFNYEDFVSEVRSGCKCTLSAACFMLTEGGLNIEDEIFLACPFINTKHSKISSIEISSDDTSEEYNDTDLNSPSDDASGEELDLDLFVEGDNHEEVVHPEFTFRAENLHRECKKAITLARIEKIFGKQDGIKIEETVFYEQYLKSFNFDGINIAIPESCKDNFDWDLLLKLSSGSLASEYEIKRPFTESHTLVYEFYITAKSGDTKVTVPLSECRSFQAYNLFRIYIDEVWNTFLAFYEFRSQTDSRLAPEHQMMIMKYRIIRKQIESRNKLEAWLNK